MYIFLHCDSENKQTSKQKNEQALPSASTFTPREKQNKQTKTLPGLISFCWTLVFFHVKYSFFICISQR